MTLKEFVHHLNKFSKNRSFSKIRNFWSTSGMAPSLPVLWKFPDSASIPFLWSSSPADSRFNGLAAAAVEYRWSSVLNALFRDYSQSCSSSEIFPWDIKPIYFMTVANRTWKSIVTSMVTSGELGEPMVQYWLQLQVKAYFHSERFRLKIFREKRHNQNPRNVLLCRKNFNWNLSEWSCVLSCKVEFLWKTWWFRNKKLFF